MNAFWTPSDVAVLVRRHGRAIERLLFLNLDGALLVDSRAQGLNIRVRDVLMDVHRGRSIDQQAEQFGAAVVTARIHELLAGVDLSEVNICNHFTFTGFESGGEAAARYRRDVTTRIRWS